MSNGNELFRRLLSGVTMGELQNLVNIREEANRPIAAQEECGKKQIAIFPHQEEGCQFLHQGEMSHN